MTINVCILSFRENQTKYVQARINHVEKHFALMCQEFGGYTRKTARLRDKADLLSKSVIAYADSEAPSTKTGLSGFAEKLSSVQDYRQAQVGLCATLFTKMGGVNKLAT